MVHASEMGFFAGAFEAFDSFVGESAIEVITSASQPEIFVPLLPRVMRLAGMAGELGGIEPDLAQVARRVALRLVGEMLR